MDIQLRISENAYKNILQALYRELSDAKYYNNEHNVTCLERTIKEVEERAYQASIFDNM